MKKHYLCDLPGFYDFFNKFINGLDTNLYFYDFFNKFIDLPGLPKKTHRQP